MFLFLSFTQTKPPISSQLVQLLTLSIIPVHHRHNVAEILLQALVIASLVQHPVRVFLLPLPVLEEKQNETGIYQL